MKGERKEEDGRNAGRKGLACLEREKSELEPVALVPF